MSEAPREQCLQAVKLALEGMLGDRFWGGEYPNPPRVTFLYAPPQLFHYTPWLGLIEADDSVVAPLDHDGTEADEFRFELYGQCVKGNGISARQWLGRLRHDCRLTLTEAIRTASLGPAEWWRTGSERLGYDEEAADFVIPFTVRLSYVLAAFA